MFPDKIPCLLNIVLFTEAALKTTPVRRWLCVFMVLFSIPVVAAENTLISNDSNSRIVVENAVVKGDETTLLFYTYPYLGDPGSGKPCPLNYYSVKLRPGLPSTRADVVAKAVCGAGLFQKSRLLDNGDTLIIIRDRLERWRAGERLKSQTFSSIDAVSQLGVTTDKTGGQFYDISPDGDVVLLIQVPGRGYNREIYSGSAMIMSSLKPDGKRRWEERFSGDPTLNTVEQIWAASGGSALLHLSYLASGLGSVSTQLHFIDTGGSRKSFELNKTEAPLDIEKMSNLTQEDLQKFFEQQRKAKPESIKKLDAVARADGGFDALFQRKGGEEGRAGVFLYRIGPDGSLMSETALGNHITEHGLDQWVDFYVQGQQLVLLSKVFATQAGIQAKRKGWSQNVVSRVDLRTGAPVTRLIPLDQRYLEAAMNAGDEQRQYLDGLPGGDAALLTTLAGVPLSASVGSISHRPTLRIYEVTDQLALYTEAYDKKQAKLAKEASRNKRSTERNNRQNQMRGSQAAAAGMTEDEFFALSKSEQAKAMIQNGGMEKFLESAMQQSQQWQTGQASSASSPQGASAAGSAPSPGKALNLNAGSQGFIEFDHPDGLAITLFIFNRQSGVELLSKDYPDGMIYEYIDFKRFNLPLNDIGVIYREKTGTILADLTPVVVQ